MAIAAKYIKAYIQTKIDMAKYAGDKDKLRILELAMIKKIPVPVNGPFPEHPLYSDHLHDSFKSLIKYKNTIGFCSSDTWGIGDSILACAREWLDSVHPLLNMALGGMRIDHMIQFVRDMYPVIRELEFNPEYIVVGSPGGNDLLQRYAVPGIIDRFKTLYNVIRSNFPKSKIIVYDLPQTIMAYVLQSKPKITKAVWDIVKNDNALLLLLIKEFTAKNKFLPKADMSMEGVHLTPLAALVFDDEIRRAKIAPPGVKFIP